MSFEDSIRKLLALGELDPHKAARVAWVKATTGRWHAAMQAMDDRCTDAVDKLSEEDFDRLVDAEQAKCDVYYNQLRAVIDHDQWPKELYFGGI